uniref:Uncharacterized protein MANES_10G046600 n=1 Tax=Rhizophora mucronata TaxID=61149 RepID=A0A2P2LUB5_RHIMU
MVQFSNCDKVTAETCRSQLVILRCLDKFVQGRSIQSPKLLDSRSHSQSKFHSIFMARCLNIKGEDRIVK